MNGQAISKFAVHFPIEVFLVVIFQEQSFRMFSFQKTSRIRGLIGNHGACWLMSLTFLCLYVAIQLEWWTQVSNSWRVGLMVWWNNHARQGQAQVNFVLWTQPGRELFGAWCYDWWNMWLLNAVSPSNMGFCTGLPLRPFKGRYMTLWNTYRIDNASLSIFIHQCVRLFNCVFAHTYIPPYTVYIYYNYL